MEIETETKTEREREREGEEERARACAIIRTRLCRGRPLRDPGGVRRVPGGRRGSEADKWVQHIMGSLHFHVF